MAGSLIAECVLRIATALAQMGAALLRIALRKRWVTQELDSRILNVTPVGRREMQVRFGLQI